MKEKELLEKHGFRFQKKYGQNFLYDPKIPAKIAQNCTLVAVPEGEHADDAILEIGPGAGSVFIALQISGVGVLPADIRRELIQIFPGVLVPIAFITGGKGEPKR